MESSAHSTFLRIYSLTKYLQLDCMIISKYAQDKNYTESNSKKEKVQLNC